VIYYNIYNTIYNTFREKHQKTRKMEEKWLLIDENGTILEKFRLKGTAINWQLKYYSHYGKKTKVIKNEQ